MRYLITTITALILSACSAGPASNSSNFAAAVAKTIPVLKPVAAVPNEPEIWHWYECKKSNKSYLHVEAGFGAFTSKTVDMETLDFARDVTLRKEDCQIISKEKIVSVIGATK